MEIKNKNILNILRNKASRSPSHIKISAIALDKKGDVIGSCCNSFRKDLIKPGKYCGLHAEAKLIGRYGTNIKTVLIMRIGRAGSVLPVDPCEKCQKLANKFGIKIISVMPGNSNED